MKFIIPIIILFLAVSCNDQKQKFDPIDPSENLSQKQIDSVLTKYNFKYETPILIDSTNQLIVPISTNLIESRKKFSYDGYSSSNFPRYWNVLFYDKITEQTKLLTKEKTRISAIHVNRGNKETTKLRSLVLYQLTQHDYNQDGKLSNKDPEFLFSSDINGEHLTQISPSKEDLQHFEVLPNSNQIILRTIRDTNQDSIFTTDDESILYKAQLDKDGWLITEIIDSINRNVIENLYFEQWLVKSEQ